MTHLSRAIEAGADAILPLMIAREISDENNLEARLWITEAVIAAYEAHLKAEGFVLVPVEPTPEIIKAYISADRRRKRYAATAKRDYRAMIAASQEQPNASD